MRNVSRFRIVYRTDVKLGHAAAVLIEDTFHVQTFVRADRDGVNARDTREDRVPDVPNSRRTIPSLSPRLAADLALAAKLFACLDTTFLGPVRAPRALTMQSEPRKNRIGPTEHFGMSMPGD